MKKQFLILVFVLIASQVYSQSEVDSLIQVGIQFHDNGQYDQAIEKYKEALKIAPNSAMAHYEIGMTYMYAREYKKSIKHIDKVIETENDFHLQAYMTKGSCLDYMGKPMEAIEIYKKGIYEFGGHYLLYYNLGYTYYNQGDYENAEEALVYAITANSNHASSHLLLAYLMTDMNQKVQSLLGLHYFLFLEANSGRSKTAYSLLQEQFGGNVTKDEDKPNTINIFLDPNQSDSEFGAADLMISMLEATKSLEENEGKSEDELFVENTGSFFQVLGELKKKKNDGLWWDFYVPLFYEIAQSEHIDTYCYYISQSSNTAAVEWLENNESKIQEFSDWLSE